MTKSERQQSLINARRACEWLREYMAAIVWVPASLKERITSLIAGFELLDASAKRPRAGRPRIKTDNPKTLAQRRWRDKLKGEK